MVCDFVEIDALPGSLLISASGEELMKVTTTFGLFCGEEFYDGDDQMWGLSRLFFYLTASFGGCTTILAWSLAIVLPPTSRNWRWLSLLSAATAVLGVPMFLIFSTNACSESVDIQTCSLSMGAYYLMCSVLLWVVVTLSTQCLDPPCWGEERVSWELAKHVETELARRAFRPKKRSIYTNAEPSLPAVSTGSMKDDELDFFSPGRLSEHSSPSPPRQQVGEVGGLSIINSPWRSQYAPSISTAMQTTSPHRANSPERPTESIQFGPDASDGAGRMQTAGRLRSSGSDHSRPRMDHAQPSASMILEDLKIVQPKNENSDKEAQSLDRTEKGNEAKYTLGIRGLTRKLNLHSHHRRLGRRPRGGYEQMLDGNGYDSDAEPMSPPIEVEIKPFAHFDDLKFDVTDDENENLMNDWNALHKATTAGIRMGAQEGNATSDEWIDFSAPVENYYSDPEPTLYSSDEEEEEDSKSFPRSAPSYTRQGGDASTISGLSGSQTRSLDSKKSRRKNRRKRIPDSPARSTKSSGESLLDVTINEETDQDVLEEISDEDGSGILGAYKLGRTMSEPTEVYSQRRLSTHGTQREESTSMHNSDASAFRRPTALHINRIPIDTAGSSEAIGSSDFGGTERRLEVVHLSTVYDSSGAKSASAVAPRRRQMQTMSLSPPRHRPNMAETWRPEGLHAQRSAVDEVDSSIRSASIGASDILRQAREHRIKRMQHDKANSTVVPILSKGDRFRASTKASTRKKIETNSAQQGDQGSAATYLDLPALGSGWLERKGIPSEDFSEMKTEVHANLPVFRAWAPENMGPLKNRAPALSPISKTDGNQARDLVFAKHEDMEEFPTMTTEAASDVESFDDREFEVDADIQMMTGIEPKGSSSSEEQHLVEDDFEQYGSLDIDDLDLQLIAVRRPLGQEYGDDESSI